MLSVKNGDSYHAMNSKSSDSTVRLQFEGLYLYLIPTKNQIEQFLF